MTIYALDKDNIDDFAFLVSDTAAELVKDGEAAGFVAKLDEEYVGGLVGHFIDPAVYKIESIYVVPEARKNGAGEFLLETLYDVLGRNNAELSVTFTLITEEQKYLAGFLESQGFEEYRDFNSHVFATTLAELNETGLGGKKQRGDDLSFSKTNKKLFTAFNKAKHAGFTPMPEGGFLGPRVEKEISTAVVKDDKILAYAAVEKTKEGHLVLSCLYSEDRQHPATLLALLRTVLFRASEVYPPETIVLLPVVNRQSERLFSGLFAEGVDLNDILVTYKKQYYGDEEKDFDGVPLSDFLADAQAMYYEIDDPEGAYLTEYESILAQR